VVVVPVVVEAVVVAVETGLVVVGLVVVGPVVVVVVGGVQGTIVVDVVVLASLGPQTVGLFSPNRIL
jgi:hypothetical protein